MLNKVFFILALFSFNFSVQGQFRLPSWVQEIPVPAALSKPDPEIKSGWAYLLYDAQVDVESQTRYYHSVIKVISINGLQAASHLEVTYDPEFQQAGFCEISVTRAEVRHNISPEIKTVVREKNMEDFLYDKSKTSYMDLSDIRVGDIISYYTWIKGFNPIYNNKFTYTISPGGDFYTEKEYWIIHVNASRNLQFKYYKVDKKFSESDQGDMRTYTIEFKRLEPITSDPNIPSWYKVYPYVTISEFSNRDLIAWVYDLLKIQPVRDKNLVELIMAVKNKFRDPPERALASLEFVQNEIRYLGDESGLGAYKPHSPDQVYRQRYGDCKDKSLLLSTMLNQMGIEACPALVNTSGRYKIIDELPSPGNFDHCIVYTKINGKELWLDPTRMYQGGDIFNRYIPNFGYALVADGQDPIYRKVISETKSGVEIEETYLIKDFTSAAELNVITRNYGYEAETQRATFKETELKKIGKDYINFYAGYFPSITQHEEIKTEDSLKINRFTVKESYDIDSLWKFKEGEYSVSLDPGVFSGTVLISENRYRTQPLALKFPLNFTQKIVGYLPREWNVKESNDSIINKYFRFTANQHYFTEIHKIEMTYHIETFTDFVDPDGLDRYFEDLQKMKNLLGTTLTYTINKSISASSPINWFLIKLALIIVGAASFLAYRLYVKFDPPASEQVISNQKIGGWLILVAIGLVLGPINNAVAFLNGNYFTNAVWWNNISNRESASYNPGLEITYLFEFIFNLVIIVYGLLLAFLFFRRRTSLIRLIIIYFTANAVYSIIEMFVANLLQITDTQSQEKALFSNLLIASIWIPYFVISKRVKETFVMKYRN